MSREPVSPADWKVPACESHEFVSRRSRFATCVFVINEGERILRQLQRMQGCTNQVDVILADGGSSDGSTEHGRLQSLGVNTLLVKTGPGKLGAQMRMALAFALRRGYEGLVVMDGNNKDDPRAIPDFVRELEAGVDHVQGSRFIAGGKAVNTPPSRYWGVRLVHSPLISLASGFRYTDTTNGFRAYSRRFLTDAEVNPFRDVFSGYELHYYLAIQAAQLGFLVKEIPVCREYPAHGPTPSKIHGVRGNLVVLQKLFGACLGQYDERRERRAA